LDLHNQQTNGTFKRIYDLESLINPTFPQSTLSLHYDGIVGGGFLLETQYSRKRFASQRNGSQFTDLVRGTPIIGTSATRFNSPNLCGVCGDRQTFNRGLVVKASRLLSGERLGDHTVVSGLEYFSEQ